MLEGIAATAPNAAAMRLLEASAVCGRCGVLAPRVERICALCWVAARAEVKLCACGQCVGRWYERTGGLS